VLGGKKKVVGEPEDHALGRSRGGFGTKLHFVTDTAGIPLGVTESAGQAHDSRFVGQTLASVKIKRGGPGRPRSKPRVMVGDKGYSYPTVRRYFTRRGIECVIPTRKDQQRKPCFDQRRYRQRNAIERSVGWLKGNRRLATRHEKLAVNFHAMAQLAMLGLCMRVACEGRLPDRRFHLRLCHSATQC
jgi:transposase